MCTKLIISKSGIHKRRRMVVFGLTFKVERRRKTVFLGRCVMQSAARLRLREYIERAGTKCYGCFWSSSCSRYNISATS